MNGTCEHFLAAAMLLAAAGPVKQRLATAYINHLADIDQDELPHEVRGEFEALVQCLSCVRPLRGETAVQATVRKMSDHEAGEYAVRIVGMFGVLARLQAYPRQPMLRAVNSGD